MLIYKIVNLAKNYLVIVFVLIVMQEPILLKGNFNIKQSVKIAMMILILIAMEEIN